MSHSTLPLSALLSQLLVAFTVELDGEFELQMIHAGYPGARLSLVLWTGLMRFTADGPISVRELTARAEAPVEGQLGCLERWRFVELAEGRRPGWGSGRGIRNDTIVRLTARGRTAVKIWPPLPEAIEQRWEQRFGKNALERLRRCARRILGAGGDATLPDLLSLPNRLSSLLAAFQQEYDRESAVPLRLCANTLRVLGETPTRASEIPRLTGSSPEGSDAGWQLKPYIIVTADPSAKRGKVVALSPRGLAAQQTYHRLTAEIEQRWESKFGEKTVRELRESLQDFLTRRGKVAPLLAEGLIPPPGTVRAGDQAPALGRLVAGPAARQRARDLVAQTQAFVQDPAGALPHYPMWDMNRGFGP